VYSFQEVLNKIYPMYIISNLRWRERQHASSCCSDAPIYPHVQPQVSTKGMQRVIHRIWNAEGDPCEGG